MTIYVTTILFILALLVIWLTRTMWRNRSSISLMKAMMASMGIGMSVGLTIGVLFGLIFQGHFLLSTLLSMGIGMLVGICVGMPTHILAVLDGLLAGLMGGMMGAMVGEMMPFADGIVLTNILFMITCLIALLLFYLCSTTANNDQETITKKWLIKPFSTFCMLIIFFIGLHSFQQAFVTTPQDACHHHDYHNDYHNDYYNESHHHFPSDSRNDSHHGHE